MSPGRKFASMVCIGLLFVVFGIADRFLTALNNNNNDKQKANSIENQAAEAREETLRRLNEIYERFQNYSNDGNTDTDSMLSVSGWDSSEDSNSRSLRKSEPFDDFVGVLWFMKKSHKQPDRADNVSTTTVSTNETNNGYTVKTESPSIIVTDGTTGKKESYDGAVGRSQPQSGTVAKANSNESVVGNFNSSQTPPTVATVGISLPTTTTTTTTTTTPDLKTTTATTMVQSRNVTTPVVNETVSEKPRVVIRVNENNVVTVATTTGNRPDEIVPKTMVEVFDEIENITGTTEPISPPIQASSGVGDEHVMLDDSSDVESNSTESSLFVLDEREDSDTNQTARSVGGLIYASGKNESDSTESREVNSVTSNVTEQNRIDGNDRSESNPGEADSLAAMNVTEPTVAAMNVTQPTVAAMNVTEPTVSAMNVTESKDSSGGQNATTSGHDESNAEPVWPAFTDGNGTRIEEKIESTYSSSSPPPTTAKDEEDVSSSNFTDDVGRVHLTENVVGGENVTLLAHDTSAAAPEAMSFGSVGLPPLLTDNYCEVETSSVVTTLIAPVQEDFYDCFDGRECVEDSHKRSVHLVPRFALSVLSTRIREFMTRRTSSPVCDIHVLGRGGVFPVKDMYIADENLVSSRDVSNGSSIFVFYGGREPVDRFESLPPARLVDETGTSYQHDIFTTAIYLPHDGIRRDGTSTVLPVATRHSRMLFVVNAKRTRDASDAVAGDSVVGSVQMWFRDTDDMRAEFGRLQQLLSVDSFVHGDAFVAVAFAIEMPATAGIEHDPILTVGSVWKETLHTCGTYSRVPVEMFVDREAGIMFNKGFDSITVHGYLMDGMSYARKMNGEVVVRTVPAEKLRGDECGIRVQYIADC